MVVLSLSDHYNAGNVSVTRLQDGLPVELVDVVERAGRLPLGNVRLITVPTWVPALKTGSHLSVYAKR